MVGEVAMVEVQSVACIHKLMAMVTMDIIGLIREREVVVVDRAPVVRVVATRRLFGLGTGIGMILDGDLAWTMIPLWQMMAGLTAFGSPPQFSLFAEIFASFYVEHGWMCSGLDE